MKLRILRYGTVGIVSTIIHASSLLVFSQIPVGGGVANLISFVLAFGFSFKAQQFFVFKDRLGNQQLNQLAFFLIFGFNILSALVLGGFLQGNFRVLLPFAPAAINYLIFYVASGLSLFRK